MIPADVLNARPPLPVRFQVTDGQRECEHEPDDHRRDAQDLECLGRPLEELFSSHVASALGSPVPVVDSVHCSVSKCERMYVLCLLSV